MKPEDLKTKIFLDSGDPNETKEAIKLLGFLDGQTTNPTLIAKNPKAKKRFEAGDKFTSEEIMDFYQNVVKEISSLIPDGSVSVEVYADQNTTAEEMIKQCKEMFSWIPNAHIKLPITNGGLMAAEELNKEKVRLNLTLCFTQEQAAAVYAATKSAQKGDVFVSPFVGRLDDRNENGMDLIANIITMYQQGDGHVEVLSASVRNYEHFLYSLKLEADIITAPLKVYQEWAEKGMEIPKENYIYPVENLAKISYKNIDLTKNWQEYNIAHELTNKGIERFADDWNALIGQ
jgi:transaldolase